MSLDRVDIALFTVLVSAIVLFVIVRLVVKRSLQENPTDITKLPFTFIVLNPRYWRYYARWKVTKAGLVVCGTSIIVFLGSLIAGSYFSLGSIQNPLAQFILDLLLPLVPVYMYVLVVAVVLQKKGVKLFEKVKAKNV